MHPVQKFESKNSRQNRQLPLRQLWCTSPTTRGNGCGTIDQPPNQSPTHPTRRKAGNDWSRDEMRGYPTRWGSICRAHPCPESFPRRLPKSWLCCRCGDLKPPRQRQHPKRFATENPWFKVRLHNARLLVLNDDVIYSTWTQIAMTFEQNLRIRHLHVLWRGEINLKVEAAYLFAWDTLKVRVAV